MLHCAICHATFESQLLADAHFNSKAHSNAVKFQRELSEKGHAENRFYCETCSIWTTSQALLNVHLECQSHCNKLKNRALINEYLSGSKSSSSMMMMTKSATVLDINSISSSPPINNNDHDQVLDYMKSGVLYCQVCSVKAASDQDYLSHVKTSGHVTRMACLKSFNELTTTSPKSDTSSDELSNNNSSSLKTSPTFSLPNITDSEIEEIKRKYASMTSCPCCYTCYTSADQKLIHLNGRDHLKKLIVKEFQMTCSSPRSRELICSTCFIKCNSDETYRVHVASDSHLSQEAKRQEYLRRTTTTTGLNSGRDDSNGFSLKRSPTTTIISPVRKRSIPVSSSEFVSIDNSMDCDNLLNQFDIDLVVFQPGQRVLERVLTLEQDLTTTNQTSQLDQKEFELFEVLNRRLFTQDES